MIKKIVSRISLMFLFTFNGLLILAAFIIPQFYQLNPIVVGEYSGKASLIWGALTILAVVLGFGFYPKNEVKNG